MFQLRDKATGQRNKRFLWKCRGCKRQFTVRIGMDAVRKAVSTPKPKGGWPKPGK